MSKNSKFERKKSIWKIALTPYLSQLYAEIVLSPPQMHTLRTITETLLSQLIFFFFFSIETDLLQTRSIIIYLWYDTVQIVHYFIAFIYSQNLPAIIQIGHCSDRFAAAENCVGTILLWITIFCSVQLVYEREKEGSCFWLFCVL